MTDPAKTLMGLIEELFTHTCVVETMLILAVTAMTDDQRNELVSAFPLEPHTVPMDPQDLGGDYDADYGTRLFNTIAEWVKDGGGWTFHYELPGTLPNE